MEINIQKLKIIALHGLFAYVWLLLIGVLIAQLYWPFNVDQGMFAFVGSRIVEGGMPYKDGWEVKGPAVQLIYAAVEWLGGRETWPIRVFDGMMLIVTCMAFIYICKSVSSVRMSLWVAPVAGFMYLQNNWISAQPDAWAGQMMLMMLAVIIWDKERYLKRSAFLVGTSMMVVTCFKPFYILFYLPLILYLLYGKDEQKPIWRWIICAVMVTGLGGLMMLGWFALNDAFEAMWQVYVEFNLAVHSATSFFDEQDKIRSLLMFFIDNGQWIILVALCLGIPLAVRSKKALSVFALSGLALSGAIVIVQGKYSYYQLLGMLPFMMILFVYALEWLWQKSQMMSLVALVIMTWQIHSIPWINVMGGVKYMTGEISQETYHRYFLLVGKESNLGTRLLTDIQDMQHYLNRFSEEGDTVQLWGLQSMIYYGLELKPASRFGHLYPLIAGGESSYGPYRKEFMEVMEKSPPTYIILVKNDANPLLYNKTSLWHLKHFHEFDYFIRDNYMFQERFGDYSVYARNR